MNLERATGDPRDAEFETKGAQTSHPRELRTPTAPRASHAFSIKDGEIDTSHTSQGPSNY